jgi:uncharacterized protein (TIGR03546 family)
MFLVRKIGSVFRGNATPLQVLLATVLGGVLGFVPGFFLPGDLGGGLLQAPGLILLLLSLVLVLNANLGVFGLVTLVGKLLSFVLLPASYALGRWLVDGPLQGLCRGLVNGKVTAWFGFEYYATVGGVVLGLVYGVLAGMLMNRGIRAVRGKMAGLEAGSATFQKYASKGWVKLLTWLFLGKGQKKLTWQELAAQKKTGLPVRLGGLAVAAVFIASVWVLQTWFSEPVLTQALQSGLQTMNGATVDLKSAQLGLGSGELRVQGLAIADCKELGADLFAADALVATLDTGELLRKRFVVDTITAQNARSGAPRALPGVRIPGAEPPPEPPKEAGGLPSLDDVLKDYAVWKERLAQARDWIEKIAGPEAPKAEPTPAEIEAEQQRQADERARAEAAGLARVVATHLFDRAPRVLVRNVVIDGIGYSIDGKADKLDLKAKNLSDRPALVDGDLTFDLAAQSGVLAVGLQRAGRAAGPGAPALGFHYAQKGVSVDRVFGQLKLDGAAPLRGGTVDLAAKGGLQRGVGQPLSLDLPLDVTLKDTTFALAGSKETKVETLALPIGVKGPLTRPSFALSDQALQDALVKAGKQELANFVAGQAGKLFGKYGIDASKYLDPNKSVGENLDAAKAAAEAEAKRLADEAKAKAEAEAKRIADEAQAKLDAEKKRLEAEAQKAIDEAKAKAEAEKKRLEDEAKKKAADELKKRLTGGIPGLPGGGGDKPAATPEEAAKKKAEEDAAKKKAADELKKKLPGGIPGLPPAGGGEKKGAAS